MMARLLLLVVSFVMFTSLASADCLSHYEVVQGIQWRVFKEGRYTLCYDARYTDDTFIAADWIDNAFRIGEEKYGVIPPIRRRGFDLDITIFLLPVPTSRASSHTATVMCCRDRVSLEIHIMTPSAPGYGRPVDDFIKTLTHEMMNTLHYEARETPNISPPLWIREGLAEFEGYFNTTSANRAKVNWLLDYVQDNLRDEIVYGRTLDDERNTIMSMDRYNGSAAVMAFLAEEYGVFV